MTEQKTALVVGAGHNGLSCATYLARAGFHVTVFEAQDHVGGAADTREFADGFRVSACAHFLYQLRADIVAELNLEKHGLQFESNELSTIALSESGAHVTISGDQLSGTVGHRDLVGLTEFNRIMRRFAGLLSRYYSKTPPLLVNNSAQDRITLAKLGFDIRRLGKDDMREFLRIIAINIYDFLNEHFDNDLIKGALSLDAVIGTHLGPRSPNTVFTYLHRLTGDFSRVPGAVMQASGGMGSVTAAFERAALDAGVTIRTGVPVSKILINNGKTVGIKLQNGEEIHAAKVVSNVDPKTTVMSLVGARHFEAGLVKKISHVRAAGNAAKFHLALSALPKFTGLNEQQMGERLLLATDMEHVERAFNPAKYGEFSEHPVMEISIPTANDPSLAPSGKHVLSAIVQYAPYHLKAGWTEHNKQAFAERILSTLEKYAPDIRSQIVASELLTPVDLEARYGMHGGHWHHGELVLDQFMFVRPVAGAARYALPIDGLYMCGAGTHPGGGVSGIAGRNAARVIAAERGKA